MGEGVLKRPRVGLLIPLAILLGVGGLAYLLLAPGKAGHTEVCIRCDGYRYTQYRTTFTVFGSRGMRFLSEQRVTFASDHQKMPRQLYEHLGWGREAPHAWRVISRHDSSFWGVGRSCGRDPRHAVTEVEEDLLKAAEINPDSVRALLEQSKPWWIDRDQIARAVSSPDAWAEYSDGLLRSSQ